MGHRVFGGVLFAAVIAACIGLTLFVGTDAAFSMMVYNFGFLGVMILICIVAVAGGLVRMGQMNTALDMAAGKLEQIKIRKKRKIVFRVLEEFFPIKD